MVTSNTYLSQAGPLGSILGILLGAAVMLIIGRNYHYLMNIAPGPGGVYTFAKKVLGHDVGFLAGWFVLLTYIAVFWANATALPLFARYFLGDVFRFGKLYTLFDYDVYLGEALLSLAGIFLTVLLCSRSRKAVQRVMVGMGVLISASITLCLGFALTGHGGSSFSWQPHFLEDSGRLNQVILIACISPWAVIGFESISHSAEEFKFKLGIRGNLCLVRVGGNLDKGLYGAHKALQVLNARFKRVRYEFPHHLPALATCLVDTPPPAGSQRRPLCRAGRHDAGRQVDNQQRTA